MADSRQGGPADAAAANGVEGGEDWELLPEDGGDCGEETEPALRAEQGHCGGDRGEQITRTDDGRGNEIHGGCILFRQLPWAAAEHWVMYALTFGYLPAIAFLHLMMRHKRPCSLTPSTAELWTPTFFAFMSVVHVGIEILMYVITDWMQKSKLGAPFAAFLPIKLLFRLSLFVPAKIGASVLISGIEMIWGQFVKALILDAHENYRKCLGPLASLQRTPADLYGFNTSVASALWQEPLDHSREDVLRAGACLCEIISASENGEPNQVYGENLGQHMQSFVRENGLVACLWVCALCVVLLEVVALCKVVLDDISAMMTLYERCEREQRRGAATWREAFHAASLKCLRRTRYPQVVIFVSWFSRMAWSVITGLQQLRRRPDVNVANDAPSAAVDCS